LRWTRWYFLVGALAILDVFMILVAMGWRRETVTIADQLVIGSTQLGDESQWMVRAEQAILDLSKPGNSVFASRDVEGERGRFEKAAADIEELLAHPATSEGRGRGLATLKSTVKDMAAASRELFERFARSEDEHLKSEDRRRWLTEASIAMTRLDERQVAAMRQLGVWQSENNHKHTELLQKYSVELQNRAVRESYFIAAVIAFLAALVFFILRMRAADQAVADAHRRVEVEKQERLAAIGELCSSFAHGIRNPLAAIQSSAQLARDASRAAHEDHERLDDILRESRRLGERVSGLMKIARVSAQEFDPTSLGEVARVAVRAVQAEVVNRGLSLEVDSSAAFVRGDKRLLEQAVIELISNAMDHCKPGGKIRVTSANGDLKARLTVEDDGPGVPAAVRDRIFDLFFSTKTDGTGIGLATVKRVARLHGGDVELECPASGGSRFCIALPALRRGKSTQKEE
jgi:signal transduction histidine kinase